MEQANNEFALSEVRIFDATHKLLDILGPIDTNKPSLDIATTPTAFLSWADIDETSVVSVELLVDIKFTFDDAFQCPRVEFNIADASIFQTPPKMLASC